MDEAGITYAVIPGRMTNPDFGVVPNEDIQTFLEQYPGRFFGMAGIDPLQDTAISEVEK